MDPVPQIQPRETLRAPAARRDGRRRRGEGAFRLPPSDPEPLPVSAPLDDEAGTRLDLSA